MARCKTDIAQGDIIIASMLFMEDHIQAVLQGAFIIAKAKNSPKEARDSVLHLKRYIKMLFERGETG